MLVPALMAITCHEVSHGYIAEKFGDNTARSMGRLTLNPLKHLDIIGTLMVFIIGIGWAKPVPVNFNNLKKPKHDMIWVALAGPVANLILAVLSALILRGFGAIGKGVLAGYDSRFIFEPVLLMVAFSIYINLMLTIFNLIPIPPLDGGRVLTGLLPYRQAAGISRLEPYGMIIILVLIFLPDVFPFFPSMFSYLILPALNTGINLLAGSDSIIVYKVATFLLH